MFVCVAFKQNAALLTILLRGCRRGGIRPGVL